MNALPSISLHSTVANRHREHALPTTARFSDAQTYMQATERSRCPSITTDLTIKEKMHQNIKQKLQQRQERKNKTRQDVLALEYQIKRAKADMEISDAEDDEELQGSRVHLAAGSDESEAEESGPDEDGGVKQSANSKLMV